MHDNRGTDIPLTPGDLLVDAHVTLGADDLDLIAEPDPPGVDTSPEGLLRLMTENLPAQVRFYPVIVLRDPAWRDTYTIIARRLGLAAPGPMVPVRQWRPEAGGIYVNAPDQLPLAHELLSGPAQRAIIDLESVSESALEAVRALVVEHRRVPVVFAGLGGRFWRFAALLAWQFEHVYLDTAKLTRRRLRTLFASRYQLARLLRDLQDRILFASGFPILSTASALHTFLPWCRGEGMIRKIVDSNARRVYVGMQEERAHGSTAGA
jgi:hypothetical protein